MDEHILRGEVKDFLLDKLRFLPLIVDILESCRYTAKVKQLLNVLEKMTDKIVIKVIEPFSEKLIIELTKLISNDSVEVRGCF